MSRLIDGALVKLLPHRFANPQPQPVCTIPWFFAFCYAHSVVEAVMVVQNEMWWSVLSAVATCASVGLILRVSSKCRSERCKHSDDKKEWSTRTVVLALMGAPAAWILITKPDSLPLLFLFGGSTLIGLGVWDWILKWVSEQTKKMGGGLLFCIRVARPLILVANLVWLFVKNIFADKLTPPSSTVRTYYRCFIL